ncbi:arginine--tRNA ligase [Paenibacillus sp. TRM 82003]|nr:arginine--tRNA ligase [Paenibacillus sp. TRM 82003]
MDRYKKVLAQRIAAHLPEAGIEAKDIEPWIEYPPNPELGDLALPCFQLAKRLRQSPQRIANDIAARLGASPVEGVASAASAAGYVNVKLDRAHASALTLQAIRREGERYGASRVGEGRTIVIDYSSPNIAKPFHVGHLRSTVIGGALYRIYGFLGYRCVGVNHLGDWGTQFGKLIVAYRRWGDDARLAAEGIDELLRLYVQFHEEAEADAGLEDEARAWFVRMEAGDEEALALWRRFVDISLKEFHVIYELLGASFDSYAGESFYNDRMTTVVQRLRETGLLVEDDGAWLVPLEDYGMAPALMLKKDGSTLYHTRDVAAALYRKETYDFDRAIYVTDYAQQLHFRQWFKVVELMGHAWANDLVHVAFGRVSLEGASLSTRKGNVVRLDELLRRAIEKARALIDEKNPGLLNKDEVARQVGVGAIVFNDLSGNRIKDVSFSWDEALSFDGETGPYVQYAHVRACSLLRKAEEAGFSPDAVFDALDGTALADDASFDVVRELARFPERVATAAGKYEPSIVTRGLVDLAQAFNRFYREQPILVDDAGTRAARLALTNGVRATLRIGLGLIGVAAPERM